MTIKSHPDKFLYMHLEEAASNSVRLVSESPLSFSIVSKEQLRDLAYIEGAFHDFGKCMRYFQDYLVSGGVKTTGPKNHALISALLARYITKLYLADKDMEVFEKELIPFFVFTSVRRHHGNLNNFKEEISDLEVKHDELKKQADSLIRPETDELIGELLKPINIHFVLDDFICELKEGRFLTDFDTFLLEIVSFGEYQALSAERKTELFYLHELLYSILLQSDKADVILERKINYSILDPDSLKKFRKKKKFNKPVKDIDRLKNRAFNSALKNVKKIFDKDKHLYSITLPTGLGKTITSFAAAFKFRELLGKADTKVIITIPFTSIIDQNYEVYSEILLQPDSTQLLKHHHLAEPRYKCDNEELSYDQAQFLIESWNSQVIVTTFVQLFECLLNCDKTKLLKLPNICGSVIILDEVQSIDYKYWPLVREAFQTIGRTYGCYFILMSATQPLIFDPAKEITEIIPDYKTYFSVFNRTKITFLSRDEIKLDDLVFEICKRADSYPDEDILVILNTKKVVLECFEKLKYSIDPDQTDLYFLNTLITPYERKRIIKDIKERRSAKRFIVVSTQLIEAGVDISAGCVFREVAPLDSIIQAGGRANRYAEKDYPCPLYIFELEENKRNTAKLYGSELLIKTKRVLSDFIKDEIEEKNYLGMIEQYFKEVRIQSEAIDSEPLGNIYKLNFAEMNKFSLIPERMCECVFVCLNQTAEEIWDTYMNIYSDTNTDIFQKKQEFSKIKSAFYDFVINVPIPYDRKQINIDSEKTYGLYLIDPREGSNFYSYNPDDFSKNTGYHSDETIIF